MTVTEDIDVRAMLEVVGIDPAVMAEREAQHLACQTDGGYLPIFCSAPLTAEQERVLQPFPETIYDEYHSHALTLINGLRGAAGAANADSDATPSIRANTGAGTIATPFGVTYQVFDDKMPWVTEHVSLGSLDDFDAETAPLGGVLELVMERSRYLAEKLAGSGITPFCFDTQGPFDAAHLVIGDEIFLAMYDEPDRVHHLLDQCTRMIVRTTRLYKEAVGEPTDGGRHSSFAMRGGIRICEDTSTLVNGDQVQAFVVPYTRQLLQAFGGGWVHYCGRNDHLYRAVMDEIPEYYLINLGNPDMHDIPGVIADCIARGKTYYGPIERNDGEALAAYFERAIGLTGGARRGLMLTPDIREGESAAEAVALWRRLQA